MKVYFDEIIVIGSGKIASECVSILLRHFDKKITIIEHEVAMFSPFSKFNKYSNIDIVRMPTNIEVTNYLNKMKHKLLVVSANNNYLFKKEFIDKENVLIINFHNALLPKHRGRNAQMWTIFSGDKIAGATWHVVNSNIDDGDILIQDKINLDNKMTSLQLTEYLINLGIKMFDIIIPSILDNKIETFQQENVKYDIHTSKDLPNNGYIDFSKSMDEISLFLRSMDFGKIRIVPYPKMSLFGEIFDILGYKIDNNFIELDLSNQKKLKMEMK